MNERIIQREVRKLFINYEYILFNVWMFGWESDFFAISSSGYSVEVEVKCSKADFKKDFTKREKHHLFIHYNKPAIITAKHPFKPYIRNGGEYDPATHQFKLGDSSYVHFKCPGHHLPNKFYYACPEGIIKVDDVPAYAGLIYITSFTNDFGTGYKHQVVKRAPFLHKNVKDHHKDLLSKYFWKCNNDRMDIYELIQALERDPLSDAQRAAITKIKDKFF